MGSGGIFHKFWCDKCQCYVDFSDFETCESICGYCEARENKARAEAAEAEVERLRAELAAMPRPENRCHGEWPCEASTALASAEAEMARAEARAEAAEAEAARFARFLGECGYLVDIVVFSPDDIPLILDRLGALHTRAEAAEAAEVEVERLRAELAQARADALAAALTAAHFAQGVAHLLAPPGADALAAANFAAANFAQGVARLLAPPGTEDDAVRHLRADDLPGLLAHLRERLAQARADGEAAGLAAERAAVVAWLRSQGGRSAWTLVQEIEKGAHLWGVNRAGR